MGVVVAKDRLLLRVLTAGCLLAIVGCTVRVPQGSVYPTKRDQQFEHQYRSMKPEAGVTTRDTVMRELGPALRVSDDQSVMMYAWESIPYAKDYPDWFNLDPPQGRPTGSMRRIVIFQFDPEGVLAKQSRYITPLSSKVDSSKLFDDAAAQSTVRSSTISTSDQSN
jgi:hypothetical protein